uniref:Uncharacterized protein n=1 Tax=Hyaloperonospora arabidopsidis (strain Emoy2) TaxID=559515 RepID=M4BWX3_HYAAE
MPRKSGERATPTLEVVSTQREETGRAHSSRGLSIIFSRERQRIDWGSEFLRNTDRAIRTARSFTKQRSGRLGCPPRLNLAKRRTEAAGYQAGPYAGKKSAIGRVQPEWDPASNVSSSPSSELDAADAWTLGLALLLRLPDPDKTDVLDIDFAGDRLEMRDGWGAPFWVLLGREDVVGPPDTDETEVLGVGLTEDRKKGRVGREYLSWTSCSNGEEMERKFWDSCCGYSGVPPNPSRLMTQGGMKPPRQDWTKEAWPG